MISILKSLSFFSVSFLCIFLSLFFPLCVFDAVSNETHIYIYPASAFPIDPSFFFPSSYIVFSPISFCCCCFLCSSNQYSCPVEENCSPSSPRVLVTETNVYRIGTLSSRRRERELYEKKERNQDKNKKYT